MIIVGSAKQTKTPAAEKTMESVLFWPTAQECENYPGV